MVVVGACTISNGMKLSPRLMRRMVIAVIFLAVFSFTGLGLKRIVTPAPSCTDGIMNGQEEGIDCGATACSKECEVVLDPPKVNLTKLLKAGDKDYDFVAEIVNPHIDFGASEVGYELVLHNQAGEELLKREGVFYLLPGQDKFLVLPFLTTENNVGKIDFTIKSAKWQKLDSLEGMNLIVRREKYNVYGGGSSSALDAVIFNDSNFDFETVNVDVVLRDYQNEIIAVNNVEISTFQARTERNFTARWPFLINRKIAKMEIMPSTNLFENSNFIKQYGSGVEKFQQY